MQLRNLEVQSYILDQTDPYSIILLIRVPQRHGQTDKWAIRKNGNCLNKDAEWEYEPQPSSRDDAFLERCRFESSSHALHIWMQYKGLGPFIPDGQCQSVYDFYKDYPRCATCKYFQFKFSGEHAWGQCLHPQLLEREIVMMDLDRIDLTQNMTTEERYVFNQNVKDYGRIYFREDAFGCILWVNK